MVMGSFEMGRADGSLSLRSLSGSFVGRAGSWRGRGWWAVMGRDW